MRSKEELLRILESCRGKTISGQEVAEKLGMSRAGVWKQMKALREEGYAISAIRNKGYCLLDANDKLSLAGMLPYLNDPKAENRIFVFDTVDSTNSELKRMALKGAVSGTVVVADHQSAGRGRLGRSFYSPPESGVYLSVLLRTGLPVERAVLSTTAASVVACRTIENVTGKQPKIKWVNDLYLRGHKVCGILTEAITDFETGTVEALIVGIGINCTTVFHGELEKVAGCVVEAGEIRSIRNKMAAELINQLNDLENMMATGCFLDEYRSKSMVLGQEVYILQEPGKYYTAVDIGQHGELILRGADGKKRTLENGEVSIRLTNSLKSDNMSENGYTK
ncbi:biotin--[acetyl-CoA-carboxylase] ligase [Ructibacterium gallinarum]|uniref:Bifunctional ligase/repressor BirA n=1 Tax=Ructibacterium gallinarum TaxID=2779355 RepID=A0A9D5M4E4_9FIRM|nr:biotin--[acetyl-CoA-carboxylase] ligase [Ructibacterium gallinarum]MBE5039349.1 biotin--[acetyl-CoA-carboxylase] ligase [Ructibacterium gallinarum]